MLQDLLHQGKRRQLTVAGNVVGPALDLRLLAETLGEKPVSSGAVLDVEIVTDELSIRSDDREFSPQDGTNGSAHEAAPDEVAAAIEVAASGQHGREPICGCLGLGDEVGA